MARIPVVDLFAGPGGLGEGFSSLKDDLEIAVSAEANAWAHRTLTLRSAYRKLRDRTVDPELYKALFCAVNNDGISSLPDFVQEAWKVAANEALNLTIGREADDALLRRRLDSLELHDQDWILVGGPPCQAYSIAGRVRNKGVVGYDARTDGRHFLYREYLKIIQEYRPAIFVMENVKGIISSSVNGKHIFHQILKDLSAPDVAVKADDTSLRYSIHSLNLGEKPFQRGMQIGDYDPHAFTVYAENHGIPQQRHRVFLIGIRSDLGIDTGHLNGDFLEVPAGFALSGLPELRSRLSKETDGDSEWRAAVLELAATLEKEARKSDLRPIAEELARVKTTISSSQLHFGSTIRYCDSAPRLASNGLHKQLAQWLQSKIPDLVLNHETRRHMRSDLARYLFASSFAKAYGRSPKGHEDFSLNGLRPDHKNWESGHFSDRFRVQLTSDPSTTVTSHIAKDGHYYIHPDPRQCRSLTVREAARLQTFPDDYFFVGSRTHQYTQVGNAVPPFLAKQIAELLVNALASKRKQTSEQDLVAA